MKCHRGPICMIVGLLQVPASLAQEAVVQRRPRPRTPPVYKQYTATEVKAGGAIEGVVSFKGKVPPHEKIAIVKDQDVCRNHPTERPRIEVNEKGQVRD